MFEKVKRIFDRAGRDQAFHEQLERLRKQTPVPIFWLFGRTQSGKTSIIKFLTGANDAEIGQGFAPCTRYSRQYHFPSAEAPLLGFLDTRGLDEPGYEPGEDLARFGALAHMVVVTVKVLDFGLESIVTHLRRIRAAQPSRPIVLALTCLHEAYPQQQHPAVYPFEGLRDPASWKEFTTKPETPEALRRVLQEQCRRFEGLCDVVVPIDLTPPEEGFTEPNYGGGRLKQILLEELPNAYRQTLLTLDEAQDALQDLFVQRSLPHIIGYSTLAASAGAMPIPWLDLLVLPGIQTQMIYHLARLHGQTLSGKRFLELSSTLGMGMLARQATREIVKFIPFAGAVAGAALAGASTYALGKAFCHYYRAVHQGHVPKAEDLKRYYHEELAKARRIWSLRRDGEGGAR